MENNRLNKLTQQARRESYSLNHDYIGTEHVLLALMKTGSNATKALEAAGANYELLKSIVINNIGRGTAARPATEYSKKVRQTLETARFYANNRRALSTSEEDVLLAILNDEDSFTNIMFLLSGVEKEAIKKQLLTLAKNQKKSGATNSKFSENITKFCTNLNEMAKSGKIDPVIGREDEITRIIQILMRRTKNNPILIGDPGVGKTAIAEGLATEIVKGNLPKIMKDKTILSLDLASMIAGTKYRGDFEDRLKKLFEEAASHDDLVLFIDEFHMVLGAGAAEGSMDAANILKPILAKGDIQIIGATTIEEYRKHVEKDSALARRMQEVMVTEPSIEDSKLIIQGLKSMYEDHHNVKITDEAVDAAVELSDRYITDRFLPDKAIDLIDEASSKVRIGAFEENTDESSDNSEDIIEKLKAEKDQAVMDQDFEKAAKLRDIINQKKFDLENEEAHEAEDHKLEISYDDIANIVSSWSKVPVEKLTEDEKEKYANLDTDLEGTVVGQKEAIDSVARAIKRARVGLKDPNKPIGSFIFVGPTGVGKTYLAKSLAAVISGSSDKLIRIDMSEYMEKFAVSRLVGSPPGYVGYEEGGQLTEAVRRSPYTIVLLDEIEKAHPDVFNILLQVMDDGRLTDSKGRTVDFKNTILIMTSNLGSPLLLDNLAMDGSITDEGRKQVFDLLKASFKPEFLNRIDDTILFSPLTPNDIHLIVNKIMGDLQNRLADKQITLHATEELSQWIAENAYDPHYGARPLRRFITNHIENELAKEIIKGNVSEHQTVSLTVENGQVIISSQ